MDFDGRGMVCPLAFVKAKQALIKNNTKVFLLDEEVSIYNFCSYLTSKDLRFDVKVESNFSRISLSNKN